MYYQLYFPIEFFSNAIYVVSLTRISVEIWKEEDKKQCVDTKEKNRNKLNKICAVYMHSYTEKTFKK